MRSCRTWLVGRVPSAVTAILILASMNPHPIWGQELFYNLPPDGTEVVYQGHAEVTIPRPASPDEPVLLEKWVQRLTIRALGGETVAGQPCRWIELKHEQGREEAGRFNRGLSGTLLYKFLVPESAVANQQTDFLPIVRGWRKLADQPLEPLPTSDQPLEGVARGALRLWPTITLLDSYRDLKRLEEDSVEVGGLGALPCQVWQGQRTRHSIVSHNLNQQRDDNATTADLLLEKQEFRTINQGQVWISEKMPFGLVRWQAKSRREWKRDNQFVFDGELSTEMRAVAIRSDGETELPKAN